MIKTVKQAKEAQQRRFDAGKKGVAKAVRRFAKRLFERSGKAGAGSILDLKVRW